MKRFLLKNLKRGFKFKSDSEFLNSWKIFSSDLVNKFESNYLDEDIVEDIEDLDQLIKISFYDGKVFIINRQVPAQEIWYSSPISGPTHYRFDEKNDVWINKENIEFYEVFNKDMDLLIK